MAPAVPAKERRAAKRMPSRAKNPCRVLRASAEGPWSATVRNVSAKGIGLIASREFPAGTVVALDLPLKKKANQRKMMRVTHVKPQPGGKWWTMGGVFINPLGKEELAEMQVRAPAIIPDTERRRMVRHTTGLKAACQMMHATEEGPWQATIQNISAKGMSLIARHAFATGTILAVELPGKVASLAKPRMLRLTHVRGQSGPWKVLGGVFLAGLSRAELAELL